ncbi:hypothetical protein [Streptomyces sp. NPDC051173]|uniref:hypothetical protein n=1 Tax=Streptomyces sp. NPDC051173 TaxID=3155164 RepID=UPI00344C3FAC
MTDHDSAALRTLLARLITDGAHHARCAGLSRIDEGRIVHSGFAAGFHLAAMYAADILATGSLHGRSCHPVEPADETAAQHVLDHLPDNPADRARAVQNAIYDPRAAS